MFRAILIDKDDHGYRASLQELDETRLPEGEVRVREPAPTRDRSRRTRVPRQSRFSWTTCIGLAWTPREW